MLFVSAINAAYLASILGDNLKAAFIKNTPLKTRRVFYLWQESICLYKGVDP